MHMVTWRAAPGAPERLAGRFSVVSVLPVCAALWGGLVSPLKVSLAS